MASNFLKPTKIVATALGLLTRELTLPNLVWRQPVGTFNGVLNDTISIRLPAYIEARSRALRSGAARTQDNLFERKVDLTLDTDIYLDVPITDEQLTLDIADLGSQVLAPMAAGVARKMENVMAGKISGATYQNEIAFDLASDDPYKDLVLPARAFLNNAYVPYDGRVLVVGSELETAILSDDNLIKVNEAGSDQTLREATIGRLGGFTVVGSPAIPGNEGYAFHRTAFAMTTAAPVIPAGAPFGAVMSYDGFTIRLVRSFDPDAVADRLIMDAWMGAAAVKDTGHYTADPAEGGKYVPVTDPANPVDATDAWADDTARLVRAVKITAS